MNRATMTDLAPEDVQTYPRPPALEKVPHIIRIELGGGVVAESDRAYRVLETHHAPTYYIPPEDVLAQLNHAPGHSFCEWKGVARYWDVAYAGTTAHRAAWSYATPTPGFAPIAGYLAFLRVVDGGLLRWCTSRSPTAWRLLRRLGHGQSARSHQGRTRDRVSGEPRLNDGPKYPLADFSPSPRGA